MREAAWPDVALREVATIERDSVSAAEIESGTTYVGLEHITSAGHLVGYEPVRAGELRSNKFRFTSAHVLYGKLRPNLSKIVAPEFDGVCSTDILPIRPTDRVEKRYLLHFLRRPFEIAKAASLASGANLPRLSPKVLAELQLPLPPIEEQRRIAAVLDQADELRAKRTASLALLDSLNESIFLDMFGDPVTNPRGWHDSDVLGTVADIASGITKGRRLGSVEVRSVPYLAVANVQHGHLLLEAVKTIEATAAEIARFRLLPGDLVLTEGGDPDKLGRGTVWRGEIDECIHQNHIFRVRIVDPAFDPIFVSTLLASSRGRRYFLGAAKQTTGIASINKSQLGSFPMLRPPIELQRSFVQQLGQRAGLETDAARHAAELDALFASLQHRAFAGQL